MMSIPSVTYATASDELHVSSCHRIHVMVIVLTCGGLLLNCDFSCRIRLLPCSSQVCCSGGHPEDRVCASCFGSCAIINCIASVVLDGFGSIVHFG